jgi:hypothetical protein
LGMEINAGSVPLTLSSSLEKLWGAGYTSTRSVGSFVQSFLGGYGAYLPAWADARPQGQQRRLRPGELPVGTIQSTSREPAGEPSCGYDLGSANDGGTSVNTAISVAPEPVYDLINAGPRTRFVVRGAAGPMIVHNCVENFTQAIARCVIAEQMLRVAKKYKVALTVHDSVAIVAKQEEAAEAQAYLEDCMSWVPKWAAGLPLACESGVGESYGDC